MKKLITLLVLAIFIASPIIAQTKEEKKAEKAEKSLKEYESMKALVNEGNYEFVGEWATSQSGRRINLMSNPTSLKMENEISDGFLPFFGTAYSGAGYGSGSGGIEFKGPVEKYSVKFNDKKQKITIKFSVKAKESNNKYDVSLNVFGNGSTSVNINSSNKSAMKYDGKTKVLEKEKKDK
jgi:hypothetical protein